MVESILRLLNLETAVGCPTAVSRFTIVMGCIGKILCGRLSSLKMFE
jgi:hypothetical protein